VPRLVPGVLGNAGSTQEESFEDGLLEHPQYTRPQVFEGLEIPEVLRSGHHGEIARWRRSQRELTTRERRPDLWAEHLANLQAKGVQAPKE
jgi:tRNA (guanine37-N1)-methyltransferase